MISIEISQDNMKKTEVYEAVLRLLESLNGAPAPILNLPLKRKASARRASEQVGTPAIDEGIRQAYQGSISKAKSLFFLSVIKKYGVADSNQIVLEMERHYPNFTRKSIGGITGAIRRWFDKKGIILPYRAEPDRSRNGIHIFTWVTGSGSEDNSANAVDAKELLLKISERFQTQFQKLITSGQISKKDFKRAADYSNFVKEVNGLKTDYFEPSGNKLVYKLL
jgi:hypothetical protein